MALLRQWRYALPLLLLLAVIMDIRYSSFVLNKAAFHFHHGWLYLLTIFLPLLAAVYYFKTYDDKADYTVRHWFKIVTAVVFLAFLSAYFLFHMAVWLASYTPLLPTIRHELTIVKQHPSGRGPAGIVIAEDVDNNPIELRIVRLHRLREGDVMEVKCVQIGTVCRITDTVIRP